MAYHVSSTRLPQKSNHSTTGRLHLAKRHMPKQITAAAATTQLRIERIVVGDGRKLARAGDSSRKSIDSGRKTSARQKIAQPSSSASGRDLSPYLRLVELVCASATRNVSNAVHCGASGPRGAMVRASPRCWVGV